MDAFRNFKSLCLLPLVLASTTYVAQADSGPPELMAESSDLSSLMRALPDEVKTTWSEWEVAASDGSQGAWFGSSVAISGNVALIGAKGATITGHSSQGAVYVFTKSGGIWEQTQKLVASDGEAIAQFGTAIALSGNQAIITAPFATINGNPWQGAAYTFTLSSGNWTQQQKLVAGSGSAWGSFGNAVAFNSGYALISSGGVNHGGVYLPRMIHVFKSTASSGVYSGEVQTIDSPTPSDTTSGFGDSIALVTGTAFVGARTSNINGNAGQGTAYVYSVVNGSWTLSQQITAADGAARDNFGQSVATNGTDALIGSPGAMINGNISQGAVYRFSKSGGTWTSTQKITASDGTASNLFGASVNLSGNLALFGAYVMNGYTGAAYVFQNLSGTWTQSQKLIASDGVAGDVFGYYTALDGVTALVGAYTKDLYGNDQQGAAYFYTGP